MTNVEIQAMAASVYERTRREQGLPPHIPTDSVTVNRLVDLLGLLEELTEMVLSPSKRGAAQREHRSIETTPEQLNLVKAEQALRKVVIGLIQK